jgi:hypothetical protein
MLSRDMIGVEMGGLKKRSGRRVELSLDIQPS